MKKLLAVLLCLLMTSGRSQNLFGRSHAHARYSNVYLDSRVRFPWVWICNTWFISFAQRRSDRKVIRVSVELYFWLHCLFSSHSHELTEYFFQPLGDKFNRASVTTDDTAVVCGAGAGATTLAPIMQKLLMGRTANISNQRCFIL